MSDWSLPLLLWALGAPAIPIGRRPPVIGIQPVESLAANSAMGPGSPRTRSARPPQTRSAHSSAGPGRRLNRGDGGAIAPTGHSRLLPTSSTSSRRPFPPHPNSSPSPQRSGLRVAAVYSARTVLPEPPGRGTTPHRAARHPMISSPRPDSASTPHRSAAPPPAEMAVGSLRHAYRTPRYGSGERPPRRQPSGVARNPARERDRVAGRRRRVRRRWR